MILKADAETWDLIIMTTILPMQAKSHDHRGITNGLKKRQQWEGKATPPSLADSRSKSSIFSKGCQKRIEGLCVTALKYSPDMATGNISRFEFSLCGSTALLAGEKASNKRSLLAPWSLAMWVGRDLDWPITMHRGLRG